MARYNKTFKDAIVIKLLEGKRPNYAELSTETGLHENTLRRWKNAAKNVAEKTSGKYYNKQTYTSEDKFLIAANTVSMTETEYNDYCRGKGLYADEIQGWKETCMVANGKTDNGDKALREELKESKKENARLEKELRRKDKALAETAALLVLSKKVEAIWGTSNEED